MLELLNLCHTYYDMDIDMVIIHVVLIVLFIPFFTLHHRYQHPRFCHLTVT